MSFRFDFNLDKEDLNENDNVTDKCLQLKKKSSEVEFKVHTVERAKLSWESSKQEFVYTIEKVDLENITGIYYVQSHAVKQSLKNLQSNSSPPLKKQLLHLDTDLIPTIYEGGLKIWECAVDLSNYLFANKEVIVKEKRVLELGCGIGLPGISALRNEAQHVSFQDFNSFVMTNATIPSVLLNVCLEQWPNEFTTESLDDSNIIEKLFDKCISSVENRISFLSGDWQDLPNTVNTKFDVVISAETIYCLEYYERLHNTLKHVLHEDGVAYIASKAFYFGVGGGVHLWEEFVKKQQVFTVEYVKTIDTPLKREILKMVFKSATLK